MSLVSLVSGFPQIYMALWRRTRCCGGHLRPCQQPCQCRNAVEARCRPVLLEEEMKELVKASRYSSTIFNLICALPLSSYKHKPVLARFRSDSCTKFAVPGVGEKTDQQRRTWCADIALTSRNATFIFFCVGYTNSCLAWSRFWAQMTVKSPSSSKYVISRSKHIPSTDKAPTTQTSYWMINIFLNRTRTTSCTYFKVYTERQVFKG